MDNRCVQCGRIIPEGRMVCPMCEGSKVCITCGAFDLCVIGHAKRTAECRMWRPGIVYCKDCDNWMYEYDDVGLCVVDVPDIDGVQRRANDFCSNGERKKR